MIFTIIVLQLKIIDHLIMMSLRTKSFFCLNLAVVSFILGSCQSQQNYQIPQLPDFDDSYYAYALNVVNKLIEEEPENAEAHYRRAELLLMQQKTNNALASIRKAVELDEQEPVYQALYAKALLKKGQNREAMGAAKDALSKGGKSVALYEMLAQAALSSNYFSEALQYSDSALDMAPNNPYNYFLKGKALAARRDTLAAEQELLTSLKMGASQDAVYEVLVDMYMSNENFQKARFYMEKNIGMQEVNDRMRFQQAQILRRTGNADSAAVIMYRIKDSGNVNRFAVSRELMELYYEKNWYDSALHYAWQTQQYRSNDKLAKLTEARIYNRRRKYQQALNKYEEILAMDSLQQEDIHKLAGEELDYLKRKVAYLWRKQQEEELIKLKKGLAPLQPTTPGDQKDQPQ